MSIKNFEVDDDDWRLYADRIDVHEDVTFGQHCCCIVIVHSERMLMPHN